MASHAHSFRLMDPFFVSTLLLNPDQCNNNLTKKNQVPRGVAQKIMTAILLGLSPTI